jgi:hypothetical protein
VTSTVTGMLAMSAFRLAVPARWADLPPADKANEALDWHRTAGSPAGGSSWSRSAFARAHAAAALAVHRETGHVLGQSRAERLLDLLGEA